MFGFILKKTFRDRIFLISLVVLLLFPYLCSIWGKHTEAPPCGVFVEGDPDENAQKILCALEDAGAVFFESEEMLEAAVANREADCGILIPAQITNRLEKGDLDGMFRFYTQADSMETALWKEAAISAVFTVYAPYLTAASLEGGGISRELVISSYESMLSRGERFTFDLYDVTGAPVPEDIRSLSFFRGFFTVLLSLTACFGIALPLKGQAMIVQKRAGKRKAFTGLFLPELFLRIVCFLIVALGACLLSGFPTLVPETLLYTFFIICLWSFPGLLIPETAFSALVILLSGLSLGLCPIFTDPAALFPVLSKLRFLLPQYWYYIL